MNKLISYKIDYLFLFIMFIMVGQVILYLEDMPILNVVYFGLRLLSFIVVAGLLYFVRFKFTSFDIAFGVYAIIYLVTIVTNDASQLISWFSNIMNIFVFITAFKMYRHRISQLLGMVAVVFSFYVYLNILRTFLVPDQTGYLIGGNYNQMGLALFVAVVVNVLYSASVRKAYFNTGCVALVSVFSVANAGSMTATTAYVLLILCMWLSCYRISNVLIPMAFGSVLVFYVVVVVMSGEITNPFMVYFIEDILHKDLTFTSRTAVWEKALDLIVQRPVLGYGELTVAWNETMFNVKTPHNMLFLTLLTGGFVWLTSLVWISIISVKKVRQYKCYGSYFMQYAACLALLMMAVETYNWTLIFILLILMYNSDIILVNNGLLGNNSSSQHT